MFLASCVSSCASFTCIAQNPAVTISTAASAAAASPSFCKRIAAFSLPGIVDARISAPTAAITHTSRCERNASTEANASSAVSNNTNRRRHASAAALPSASSSTV